MPCSSVTAPAAGPALPSETLMSKAGPQGLRLEDRNCVPPEPSLLSDIPWLLQSPFCDPV